MNLKFHMQHDQTAGLQICKSQSGPESKMATNTKNSKTIKINLFLQNRLVYLAEILYVLSGTLVLSDIKMKKICSRIRLQ